MKQPDAGLPDLTDLLNRNWFILLLCLAVAIPMAIPPVLPLVDLGGHLGRYAVQLDAGRSPELRQWYSFSLSLLPNLGVDLLVQLLGPVIGLEPAVRVIVGAIPSLQVAGFLLLARAAHGRVPPNALFAVPLAYGLPLFFGFVNFSLGIALACLALALWIELGKAGRLRMRWTLFVGLGFLLWLCHLVGWAVFCVVAGCDALVTARDRGRSWLMTFTHTAIAMLPLLSGPIIGFLLRPASQGPALATTYQIAHLKLIWLFMAMRDRWPVWDAVSAGFLMAFAVWTWRSRHFEVHKGLAFGALLLLACYEAMPDVMLGSHYADMRLAPVIIVLFVLAARPKPDDQGHGNRKLQAALAIAALAFTGTRLAGNAVSMGLNGRQFGQTLRMLDSVPRGASLVSLFVDRCPGWNGDRRRHVSGYALARRHAFDNGQWQMPGGQLLRIHNGAMAPFDSDPSSITFPSACGDDPGLRPNVAAIPPAATYLWIVAVDPRTRFAGWQPVRADQDSVLYRRMP